MTNSFRHSTRRLLVLAGLAASLPLHGQVTTWIDSESTAAFFREAIPRPPATTDSIAPYLVYNNPPPIYGGLVRSSFEFGTGEHSWTVQFVPSDYSFVLHGSDFVVGRLFLRNGSITFGSSVASVVVDIGTSYTTGPFNGFGFDRIVTGLHFIHTENGNPDPRDDSDGVYLFGRPDRTLWIREGATASISVVMRNASIELVGFGDDVEGDAFLAPSTTYEPNLPPVARCTDVVAYMDWDGNTYVSIDDGSYDPDDGWVSLLYSPPGPYPPGLSEVTLIATDSQGASSTCTANVEVFDEFPPEISELSVSPGVLSPANHEMILVEIDFTATDNSGVARVDMYATSNEPDTGLDDADRPNDIQYLPDDPHHLLLRAEYGPNGPGRTYTIWISAYDDSGNFTFQSVTVSVPRSGGPVAVGPGRSGRDGRREAGRTP